MHPGTGYFTLSHENCRKLLLSLSLLETMISIAHNGETSVGSDNVVHVTSILETRHHFMRMKLQMFKNIVQIGFLKS
ncbi:hypothetical protein P8452_03235 [Trifolium repens]|nr:hypothetical protein P8452_03235 [Trifolium repens]